MAESKTIGETSIDRFLEGILGNEKNSESKENREADAEQSSFLREIAEKSGVPQDSIADHLKWARDNFDIIADMLVGPVRERLAIRQRRRLSAPSVPVFQAPGPTGTQQTASTSPAEEQTSPPVPGFPLSPQTLAPAPATTSAPPEILPPSLQDEGEPLPGEGGMLMLQILRLAAQLSSSPAEWKLISRRNIVPTLRLLEEQERSPERQCDALVAWLRPVSGRATQALGPLSLWMHVFLLTQQERNAGYYKTRGALADILSDLDDPTSHGQRAYLYYHVLVELSDRLSMAGDELEEWARVVNTDANNLAVTLDDLKIKDASARLMQLSAIAGIVDRRSKAAATDSPARSIVHRYFPAHHDAPVDWDALLDDMANVPVTWSASAISGSETLMLLVEILAAPARASLHAEPHKICSTLLNADTSISRSTGALRSAGWKCKDTTMLILDAAGFLWVLNDLAAGSNDKDSQRLLRRALGVTVQTIAGGWRNGPSSLSSALSRFMRSLDEIRQHLGEELEAIRHLVSERFTLPTVIPNGERPRQTLSAVVCSVLTEGSDLRKAWDAYSNDTTAENLSGLLYETIVDELGHDPSAITGVLADRLKMLSDSAAEWPKPFADFGIRTLFQTVHPTMERADLEHARLIHAFGLEQEEPVLLFPQSEDEKNKLPEIAALRRPLSEEFREAIDTLIR